MNAPSMTFAELLRQAVTEPGIVSRAYFAFHNYSIGNLTCLGSSDQPLLENGAS